VPDKVKDDKTPEDWTAIDTEMHSGLSQSLMDWAVSAVSVVFMTIQYLQSAVDPVMRKVRRRYERLYQTMRPGISDLIRFEVREVFDPEFRSEQVGSGVSDKFRDYMRDYGFTDYDINSYWASHWVLPSPRQALEMFWRLRPGRTVSAKPFTKNDLKSLLKRADYLPAYHEQLIETAYTPITRVDVRRLYRLGLIDEKEVENRFLDIGYSPEDSKLMRQFAANDVYPDESAVTLSEMKSAYVNRIISKDEFDTFLSKGGYTPDSISLMYRILSDKMAPEEKKPYTRKLTKADIISGYNEGVITDETAISQLQSIGYSTINAKYFIDIEKIQAARKKK
jgi:hypothetical protein